MVHFHAPQLVLGSVLASHTYHRLSPPIGRFLLFLFVGAKNLFNTRLLPLVAPFLYITLISTKKDDELSSLLNLERSVRPHYLFRSLFTGFLLLKISDWIFE